MTGWIKVRFDAEGLSSARLTRRFPAAHTWTSKGKRRGSGTERYYAVAYKITGLPRLAMPFVRMAVTSQYPGTKVLHAGKDCWLAHVKMPYERLWNDRMKALESLSPLGDRFHSHGHDGWMDIYARIPDDAALDRLHAHLRSVQEQGAGFQVEWLDALPDGEWPDLIEIDGE